MDFRPPPMRLGDGGVDGDPLARRWWAAVEEGNVGEVERLLEERPGLVDSRRRVLEMGTATARRVAAPAVPALMVVCDNGSPAVLRALLRAGADACEPVALSLPADSDYEPDEDDFATWLAPLCPLDRAMERGRSEAVAALLRWHPGRWESLSARLAKQARRPTSAASGAMYASMFAGSGPAAAAALAIMLEEPPEAQQLALPLTIAVSRGAAGVAQALLDAGADVEAPAPWHENLRASDLCGKPLCVAARSLNNPACAAVLLRAGAAQHHQRREDRGLGGVPAHFAAEEAETALYRFERHRASGLLNVPERAAELARATAGVLAAARSGVPLLWSPSNHSRFPAAFRRDARLLLIAIYAGARRARAAAAAAAAENEPPPAYSFAALFGGLPDASLRQRVAAAAVEHLARTSVWGCLPGEFWEAPTGEE